MAEKQSLRTFLKCLVIFGCFLQNLPHGIVYYYGNISAYTDSYFRYHVGHRAYNINPDWVISIVYTFYTIGILTVDLLTLKINIRLVELAAVCFFDVATFVTYFTVQHSVGAMLITFAIVCGYTFGVINMASLKCASEVLPERVGLASSLITSSIGLSSFFYNYVITTYINPGNLTPDVRTTNRAYFSQSRVLGNVPGVFIILGVLATVFHLAGYLLQHLPLAILKRMEKRSPYELNELTRMPEVETSRPIRSTTGSADSDGRYSISGQGQRKVLKPSEILQKKSFYLLFSCRALLTYCMVLISTYYKEFGQLWIRDDMFFAFIGVFISVSSVLFRVAIGVIVDVFGIKNGTTSILSLNAIFLSFWYIAPRLNRWFYFICCQVLFGVQGTTFILYPLAVLNLYGSKYYATNYGLIMISTIIGCLASPFIIDFLLQNSGWFSLSLVGSVGSLLNFILLICIMPADGI